MTKALIPLEEPTLTLKQKRFLKLYLELGNGSEAAWRVYHCKDRASAGAIAYENLKKLQNPVKMLMESRGLGLGRLLEVLDEGLKAEKETKDGVMVDDHGVRHKYLETAGRWLGDVEKTPVISPQMNQQFNFFSVDKKTRDDFNEKFKQYLKDFYDKEDALGSPVVLEG